MTGDTWRPMAELALTWKGYEMGRSALIDLLLPVLEGGFTAYLLANYKTVRVTAVTLGDVNTKDKRVDVEALRHLVGRT